MKLPEYSLISTVTIRTGKYSNLDDPSFAAGTLIRPFWNETLLPSWRRDELKAAKKMSGKKLVMCLIGRHWVVVEADNIKENR